MKPIHLYICTALIIASLFLQERMSTGDSVERADAPTLRSESDPVAAGRAALAALDRTEFTLHETSTGSLAAKIWRRGSEYTLSLYFSGTAGKETVALSYTEGKENTREHLLSLPISHLTELDRMVAKARQWQQKCKEEQPPRFERAMGDTGRVAWTFHWHGYSTMVIATDGIYSLVLTDIDIEAAAALLTRSYAAQELFLSERAKSEAFASGL